MDLAIHAGMTLVFIGLSNLWRSSPAKRMACVKFGFAFGRKRFRPTVSTDVRRSATLSHDGTVSPHQRRADRRRRQHLLERSFADAANNHGFKRARWRGLWRPQIQDWLIAAMQNLRRLLVRSGQTFSAAATGVLRVKPLALGGAWVCGLDRWRWCWTQRCRPVRQASALTPFYV